MLTKTLSHNSRSSIFLQEQRHPRRHHRAQSHSIRRRTTRERYLGRSRPCLSRRRRSRSRQREVGASQPRGVGGVDDNTPIAEKGFGALQGGGVELEVAGLEGRGGDVAVLSR